MKTAVPKLVPADRTYSELNAAVEAVKSATQKYAVTAPPTPPVPTTLGDVAKTVLKKAGPYIAGGIAGTAGSVATRELLK